MGIRITINAVVNCIDKKTAEKILMYSMKHGLCEFLLPIPDSIKCRKEALEWMYENWGDESEPIFKSGWVINESVIMQLSDGCPKTLYKLLESCNGVESVSLSYSGHGDFVFPEFCGMRVSTDTLSSDKNILN